LLYTGPSTTGRRSCRATKRLYGLAGARGGFDFLRIQTGSSLSRQTVKKACKKTIIGPTLPRDYGTAGDGEFTMNDQKQKIVALETVPLDQAFPNESHDLTPWLAENIDALGERLGLKLSIEQREKSVGDFRVDLLCQDGHGQQVIIENQVEETDHDHLGKLLTYLVNLEAKIAIWVTSDPRTEHQRVIEWLNEASPNDTEFYLVKVEAIRTGEDTISPLFSVLAKPDKQTKEIGVVKKEWAERHLKRFEFWKSLLDRSKDKTSLFANIAPGKENWISTGAGKAGVTFTYGVFMDSGTAELYIAHDHETGQKNKVIFDALFKEKDAIEQEVSGALEWERLDDKLASRIIRRFTNGGLASPDSWAALQDNMIEAMVRLNQALRRRLAKIEI
jgi:hypothetical protein